VRYRLGEREYRGTEISRLGLRTGFFFRNLFHHGEHRVPQVLYGMEQRALAYTAGRIIAKGIAQEKPVIAGYCS